MPTFQLAFSQTLENAAVTDISHGASMKSFRKFYFGAAAVSAAFLLESFLPIQIF